VEATGEKGTEEKEGTATDSESVNVFFGKKTLSSCGFCGNGGQQRWKKLKSTDGAVT
jgi:hypothetical protein